MKPTALGSAIRSIVWAEVALTAALGTSAYAQTTPVDGNVAAEQAGSTTAAAPAPASGTAAGGQTVKKLDKFEVTGSLIRTSDKVGHTEVQVITAKEIQQSLSLIHI